MKSDLQRFPEGVRKKMIFDHLHGHLRERHRVQMVATMVTCYVEHTNKITVRIEDRHA
jgi:hypothetical protein